MFETRSAGELADENLCGGASEGDTDMPEFAALSGAHIVRGMLEFVENAAGRAEQSLPGRSDLHGARRAVEQLRAQFLLQCLYGAAYRRLRQMEAFGRSPEVQFFRDGDECSEVLNFHSPMIARGSYIVSYLLHFRSQCDERLERDICAEGINNVKIGI
ncbi:hypothetical protein Agsp01_37660 [Agromyces sp. NBRC 114283]|nr:hypothetical protein Agsp01_37660 [Agromyces sp. NBRC 114283]